MARRAFALSYINKDTPLHRMTGGAKLLSLLFMSLAAMLTFDTRLLVAYALFAGLLFIIARMPIKDMKLIFTVLLVFMTINVIITYLFSPEEGVRIYGTRVVYAHIFGRYYIIREQIFYQFNVTIKYFAILPLALVFFVTTEPSEFASSLNAIGVNYKIAYSVSLALRYIPTVMREYQEISQAQQARGIDISKKVSLPKRVKGMISILFPLIVTSIDKIDRIASAMELRSFGKNKTRTWYRAKSFRALDYTAIIFCALLIALSIVMNIVNGGRFFNPFV